MVDFAFFYDLRKLYWERLRQGLSIDLKQQSGQTIIELCRKAV